MFYLILNVIRYYRVKL